MRPIVSLLTREGRGFGMWTCQVCGKSHEDQFDSCWWCADENVSALTLPSVPARRRGLGWLLLPPLLGVSLGKILAVLLRSDIIMADIVAVAASGAGVIAGIVLWAFFPYPETSSASDEAKPISRSKEDQCPQPGRLHSPHCTDERITVDVSLNVLREK
jgi:hypothetical protein